MLIDLAHQLPFDFSVLVHVQILHQVIDADLGRLDSCQVDYCQVIEHGHVRFRLVSDLAVDFIAIAEHDRKEIVVDLASPDLSQLLLLYLAEEVHQYALVVSIVPIVSCQVVLEQLGKEKE